MVVLADERDREWVDVQLAAIGCHCGNDHEDHGEYAEREVQQSAETERDEGKYGEDDRIQHERNLEVEACLGVGKNEGATVFQHDVSDEGWPETEDDAAEVNKR